MRDRRLRQLERVSQVAHAALLAGCQTTHDRDTRRIGERPESRREIRCGLRFQRWNIGAAAERLKDGKGLH